MTAFQKIAGGVAIAMIVTALALPGRSSQETAVLSGLTNLSKGTISSAEGQAA
jgi:hypothetical protein